MTRLVDDELERAVRNVEEAFGAQELTLGELAARGGAVRVECRGCGRAVDVPAAKLSSVHPASGITRIGQARVLKCRECGSRDIATSVAPSGPRVPAGCAKSQSARAGEK